MTPRIRWACWRRCLADLPARSVDGRPPSDQRVPSKTVRTLLTSPDATLWIATLEGLASWKDGSHGRRLAEGPRLDADRGWLWNAVGGRFCAADVETLRDSSYEDEIPDRGWRPGPTGGVVTRGRQRQPVGGQDEVVCGDGRQLFHRALHSLRLPSGTKSGIRGVDSGAESDDWIKGSGADVGQAGGLERSRI